MKSINAGVTDSIRTCTISASNPHFGQSSVPRQIRNKINHLIIFMILNIHTKCKY